MATPRATAPAQARRIVSGSPAWKPQAMLALVTTASRASSSPSRQAPKLSPRSAFRSMTPGPAAGPLLTPPVLAAFRPGGPRAPAGAGRPARRRCLSRCSPPTGSCPSACSAPRAGPRRGRAGAARPPTAPAGARAQPVGQRQVPVDVLVAGRPPGQGVTVGGQQDPAVRGPGRVKRAEVGALVAALQDP